MAKYNIEELDKKVKEMLSSHRYKHSLNVADLAKEIAEYNDIDPDTAYVAGLLHDITKELDDDWQDECLKKHNDIDKLDFPRKTKHSYTAKYYLKDELGIVDEDILDAVYNHTICKSDKKLSKIIFIADKREVGRNLGNEAALLAKRDLQAAYLKVKAESDEYRKQIEWKN